MTTMPANPTTATTFDHDVHAAALALAPNFLGCRDLGHTWTFRSIHRDQSFTLTQFVRTVACESCTTIRRERLSASGVVYSRSYEYPDGYALSGFGHRTANRAAFRRVFLERNVDASDLDG